MADTADVTRWGETYDELAAGILADPDAPEVLRVAARAHQAGEPLELRRWAELAAVREADARALTDRELAEALRRPRPGWSVLVEAARRLELLAVVRDELGEGER